MIWRCWPFHPTRVELQSSADHYNSPWMIAGLIADISQRFCASYKEAAAETALISNHPVSSAILADHEDQPTRRRFAFGCGSHRMSPD
jgi:hypothetical protein